MGIQSSFLALYPKQIRRLCKVAATQSLYCAALRSDRKDLSMGCSGTIDCEVAPPGSRFQPWRKLDGYEPALIPGALTGASPTADRLVHSGQTESHLCRWCHKEKETMAHLAGNCEEVVRILGRPFLPMQDQPNLATHGIFEVPPCLLQSKNEWDGRDLPPLEVSESRITIWGDGSCINPEHFFTRTLGFAIVDCQGLLIYKFGQHDPLASSYKAELFALVAAVKTRGALLCYVTDCKSVKDTFEMVRDLGYIPANLPFAKWWNDVFNAAGFKDQCVLQMQWIKAHQFDADYGVIAPLFRNNKIADNYAHAAALESCPVAPQSFRTWRRLVVTHQAWLCKLLKLIASQKDQQREQIEILEIDDDDAADISESVQLRNRFCNWDWTVPIEHYDWTCTNEPDPAPPSHWRFGLRAWSQTCLFFRSLRWRTGPTFSLSVYQLAFQMYKFSTFCPPALNEDHSGNLLLFVDWIRFFFKEISKCEFRLLPRSITYCGRKILYSNGYFPKGVFEGGSVFMTCEVRTSFAQFILDHPALGRTSSGWAVSLGQIS
eukprot:Skav205529  [mRNA]  locus=scaffold4253:210788:212428:- [translate_table: standard]